jgi:hypothetical protein
MQLLQVEGQRRRRDVELLRDHPRGEAIRRVLDQQAEHREAARLRERAKRGEDVGRFHVHKTINLIDEGQ